MRGVPGNGNLGSSVVNIRHGYITGSTRGFWGDGLTDGALHLTGGNGFHEHITIPRDNFPARLENIEIGAITPAGKIVTATGLGDSGGFFLHHGDDANSRCWKVQNDFNSCGGLSLAKETAKDSGTYETALHVTVDRDILPGADAAQDLGSASFRYSTVFAATGSINTSDAREKRAVGDEEQ